MAGLVFQIAASGVRIGFLDLKGAGGKPVKVGERIPSNAKAQVLARECTKLSGKGPQNSLTRCSSRYWGFAQPCH